MKKIISFLMFFALGVNLPAQTFFYEDFESGISQEWTQQYLSSTASWYIENGGLGGEHPDTAYEGINNVILQQDGSSKITRLITPRIDLSDALKAQLNFAVIMTEYVGVDELYVDVRLHPDSSWVTIASYTTEIPIWTLQELQIPDSLYGENSVIGFRGKTNYGGGICIDQIEIMEVGLVSLYVKSIEASNFIEGFAPTGTDYNPVFRTIINVVGNTGSLNLQEITFQSKNTDDNDVKSGGLTLFYNADTSLRELTVITEGKSFSSGAATFDGLSVPLSFGKNVFWLTYNIKGDNAHARHDHILDASINIDDIVINATTYPLDNLDPRGYQLIKEALFFDNFEDPANWTLTGEFEIDSVQGLGKTGNGNPDPERAISTPNVLGTDITGLGNTSGAYENNLTDAQYTALSPYVNIDFYKELVLNYWRWLNVDYFDLATIDVKKKPNEWTNLWYNSVYSSDNYWRVHTNELGPQFSYKDSIQVRFALGPSDEENNQSGWNIDNFAVLGNYIEYDVGVVAWLEPDCGCSHTNSDIVKVKVVNFGGAATPSNFPIRYSLDNGTTWVEETVNTSIAIGDTATYTFAQTADLSVPGNYSILAETVLSSDEWNINNRFDTVITVIPNYTIPYTQSFERGPDFWQTGGVNGKWEIKSPHFAVSNPYIDTAYHGVKCWVTNYEGTYSSNDSSYIETPCFDFTSTVAPIMEFAIFTDFESSVDGANVFYSLDGGDTWNFLAENTRYSQNWYTNNSIEALEHPGWDQPNTGWLIARNLLPSEVTTSSEVKFRIYIQANEDTQNEGIAVDFFKLYEAPYDLEITSLIYPQTSCELSDTVHPVFEVTNLGVSPIPTGSKMPVSLYLNSEFVLVDTFTLATKLEINNTQTLTFDTTLYMDTAGNYNMMLINKFDLLPNFYNTDNDTLISSVDVTGIPQYNPFPLVTGKQGAFVTLDAGAGYTTYQWSDGTTTTQTYNAFAEGRYIVTVTNENGCTALDSTYVVNSLKDVELTQVLTPLEDSCFRSNEVFFKIELTNIGEEYTTGEKIPIAYSVNENEPVLDSITLTENFSSTSTIQYTFTQGIDMSEANEYLIKIYCNIEDDLDLSNDTIYNIIHTWGLPKIAFTTDTIYTAQVDTLTLDAGDGFASYLWQDNSSSQTFNVLSDVSSMYYVTIDDINGCGLVVDSIFVNTQDIEIANIITPTTACSHSENEDITFSLHNTSGNIIPIGQTIDFTVVLNETTTILKTYTLAQNIGAHASLEITLNTDLNLSDTGVYELSIWSSKYQDSNPENDTIKTTFRTIGYPDVDLLHDTIYTTRPDTLIFYAGNQFNSYLWHDGSDTPSFEADQDTSFVYSVTVSNNDGCGVDKDSVQVFTYDLKLVSIHNPTNACELSNEEYFLLKWKNNGPDNIYAGESYTLSYKIDEGDWFSQNYTIPNTIESGDEFIKQISPPSDMANFKRYRIQAAISFNKDANLRNDSIRKTIETYGYPEISIGPDTLHTLQPDTVKLIVTPSSYISYSWNVGIINDTLLLDTLNASNYVVTVYDIYGCSVVDSIYINSRDISIDDFITPTNSCEHNENESVTIQIRNTGIDTLFAGEIIDISLIEPETISEQIVLENNLLPDSTFIHTFTGTIDLSNQTSYNFTASVYTIGDVESVGNEYSEIINTQGLPTVTVNYDTLRSLQPDTATLVVLEKGYEEYLWDVGVDSDTLDISPYNQTSYVVEVTDVYGCKNSATVIIDRRNLAIETLNNLSDECEHSDNEIVAVRLRNTGYDTIFAGETFTLNLTSPVTVANQITLAADLKPDDVIITNLSQTIDLSTPDVYDIHLNIDAYFDANSTDNYFTDVIETYGNPVFNFNYKQLYTTQPDTVLLIVTPSTFEHYQWSVGVDNDSLLLAGYDDDFYAVTVTDANGCQSDDTVFVGSKNLSLFSLIEPINACTHSAVENITVRILNSGDETIETGSNITINVASPFNIEEQFVLESDLQPNDFINYTFNTTTDMSLSGAYQFNVEITTNFDVSSDDDQLSQTVHTFGPAFVDLGDDTTISTIPYILNAGAGLASYVWHDDTENQTFTIKASTITPSGVYAVTVMDANGCVGTDNKTVHVDIIDWAADEILAPLNSCYDEFDNEISIQISNQSEVPVRSGRTFNIGYIVNNGNIVEETFTTTDSVYPEETLNHVFTNVLEFQPLSNTLEIQLNNENDINANNNIETTSVMLYNPVVTFPIDTIVPTQFPYELEAPSGFVSYEWATGQSGQTIEINQRGTYIVTVWDSYGCTDTDDVYVDDPNGIFFQNMVKGEMRVWPNPAREEMQIELNRKTGGKYTLEIISSRGKLVWKKQLESGDNQFTVPVSGFADGMYMIRFYDSDEYMIENVVIEK